MIDNERKKEITVGAISILAIAILIIGIILGKDMTFGGGQEQITLSFPSSGGIKPSAPLVVNGVERGRVNSITNRNDSVYITATIDYTSDFKEDAFARITILEITGGKKLEIMPGKSTVPFKKGSVIKGSAAADLADLVAIVGDISGDLVGLVHNLDTLIRATNSILADDETIGKIKSAINEASEMLTTVNGIIQDNKDEFNSTMDNIKILTEDLKDAIKKHEPNINELLTELKSASSKANSLLDKADSSIDELDKLFSSVNSIVDDIKSNESILNKLLYDKELAARLDTAISNLGSFVDKINEHGVNVNVRLGTRP